MPSRFKHTRLTRGALLALATCLLSLPATASATEWSVKSPPVSSDTSIAVSCASATVCTAVGDFSGLTGTSALAENWGTEEKAQTVQAPAERGETALTGVSCLASDSCFAVGTETTPAGKEITLAEHLEGKWSQQTTPNPAGAKASHLAGVSCRESECIAVGRYTNSAGTVVTLAERWNGTEWAIQTTPNPKEAKASSLAGVSCTTPSSKPETCVAVGNYTTSAGVEASLAEIWNGKEWTIQTTPNPKEAKASSLASISCSFAKSGWCSAVGHFTNSAGVEETLAEVWNGTEWTLQTTPNPKEAKASHLASVSCWATESCIAVGQYTNSAGTEKTVAEQLTGTKWEVQTPANPTGATRSTLLGVSCTSATACMASGNYTTGGGQLKSLQEEYT
jgi:hypothetical protein